jgi:NAD-dependent SIR2 family protein deacetylase
MTDANDFGQPELDDTLLRQAAQAVASADALLIGAGAGMGVDSGLPDFRGNAGFWNAYPPYAQLGLGFVDLANPEWFATDPTLAWGFYGHRLNLYRATLPHDGFALLNRWGEGKRHGYFVYTSNVDGHFQKAGFDPERVMEVHGSIHWMQCAQSCGVGPFAADSFQVDVDETTMRARGQLPACPACGKLARPNILLFSDAGWDEGRAHAQEVRLRAWQKSLKGARLVIVECGAGTAIPSVRRVCEFTATTHFGKLIRINLRESAVPRGHLGLPMGALAALRAIDERLA